MCYTVKILLIKKVTQLKRKTSIFSKGLFKLIRSLVRLFYGKAEIIGLEALPERDVIIVANHAQMNGPIVTELFMPKTSFIWCAGEMMNLKDVPEYAFRDFWSQKPRWTHPFYKLLSYVIAPLSVAIFNNARTIAVYHDERILSTFRTTVSMLQNGNSIIIFPEKDEACNNIVYAFHDSFIDVARLYYRRTGRTISFVPAYIAPELKKVYIGEAVAFNPEAELADERSRISKLLSDRITETARALPKHTVVPYRNIPKKNYLSNKDIDKLPKL